MERAILNLCFATILLLLVPLILKLLLFCCFINTWELWIKLDSSIFSNMNLLSILLKTKSLKKFSSSSTPPLFHHLQVVFLPSHPWHQTVDPPTLSRSNRATAAVSAARPSPLTSTSRSSASRDGRACPSASSTCRVQRPPHWRPRPSWTPADVWCATRRRWPPSWPSRPITSGSGATGRPTPHSHSARFAVSLRIVPLFLS